jgi:hypothetical protein
MPDIQAGPPPPEKEEAGQGGVEIQGRAEVSVGGDLAGRDIVRTSTTNVGFSVAAVQRLVITVGALVFVTAACFFIGGIVVGGAVIAALNRSVNVSAEAADSMQAKLNALQALPAGAAFQQTFTEEELNSYWQLTAGPQVGMTPGTGKVRLLDDNKLLVAGRGGAWGNLMLAAVFAPQLNHPGQPFRLDSAAVRVLPLGATSFGWLPLPAAALQPLAENVNRLFSPTLEFTAVTGSAPAGLTVDGVGH